MTTCYEAAREYLRLGLHPIPCAPRSKRPMVEWRQYQTEPPHADQIDEWWQREPGANVALVLGRGTFAVDLDGGHDAEKLLIEHGVYLPGAPRVKTAGGYHVYLAAPGPVPDRVALLSTRGKKPQVDIRGVGIVVAPPSTHPTGATYEWYVPLALPLPSAPQALLDLIHAGAVESTPAAGAGWVAAMLHGVPDGQRDVTCTRLAGYFLGRGLDAATVETILGESFARNCTPPLDVATVRKCVQSIAHKHGVNGTAERTIAPVPLARVLGELVETLKTGPPPVVPTPYPALNHFLSGGFAPGELVYLGARASVGKTALGLEVARAAAKQKRSVLIVSREMLNLALARRLVAQEGRISASALRTGNLGDGERLGMQTAIARLRGLPIWLTHEAVSLAEITSMVADWQASATLDLLIVDYLQLVRAPRDVKERRLQVEAISQGLKTLAGQCGLPVLCLSSLRRREGGDDERRPSLSDLRESGELEFDADVVLFLHRKLRQPETECIVAKNRDGRQGTARLIFRSEFVAFDEATEREP